MPKKYIIKFDREACIGAAACIATDPDDWVMDKDGKAMLVGAKWKEDVEYFVKEIDESALDRVLSAAKACPVVVIHIIDKETGEQLI